MLCIYALYLCFCTTSYTKHNIGPALLKYRIYGRNTNNQYALFKIAKTKLSRLCVAPQRHYQSRVAPLFALNEHL